jgi:hypothetical protein
MNKLGEKLTNNIIWYAKDYVTIEKKLRIFPLLVGDITAILNYTDSHHTRIQLFNKLIEARTLERLENHKIVKNIISIDPNTLNELDLVLQKGLIEIINKIK